MRFAEKELNKLSNGILLRADLHRLFDANLMAINPQTFTAHFSSLCGKDYKDLEGAKVFRPVKAGPTSNDLTPRWKEFNK